MKMLLMAGTALLGLAASEPTANAQRAFPVTWTFFETSCNYDNGTPCRGGPLPAPIATLDLANLDSSGSFSRVNLNFPMDGPYQDTGSDAGFTFSFLGVAGPPFPQNSPGPSVGGYYSWDISFTSSGAGLSLFANFFGQFGQFVFAPQHTGGDGYVATDGTLLGCNDSQCTFTGYWKLTAVPFVGTPGKANCLGKSVSELAQQYGGLKSAAAALGYASVAALQDSISVYCAGSSLAR